MMITLPSDRCAILLAGGQSRRMGQDKINLALGSQPLGARVFRIVSQVADRIVVVSSRSEGFPVPGAWVVPDRRPGCGPLEGLASGFEASGFERALVVAADMPFLSPTLLHFLSAQTDDADAIVPCSEAGPEPLVARYSRRVVPLARTLIDQGERALRTLLARIDCRVIPWSEVKTYDAEGNSFCNLNDPADFARAVSLLEFR